MNITGAQIFLSSVIIFILYKTAISYKKNKLSKIFTLIWIIFWIIPLFFILNLSVSIKLAKLIGISRGVDLIIYLSIILIFFLLYKIFTKFNEIDRKITKIIREDALNNSKKLNERQKTPGVGKKNSL